jgi:hypothetical protein
MTPPQVTASDEVALRSLSNFELAATWLERLRSRTCAADVLREFRLREWERHEEMAEAYDHTCMPPPFRPLHAAPKTPVSC